MRKYFVSFATATVAAGALITGAWAQTATQDVTITATVAAFCTIDALATGTARTASATSQITNGQVAGGVLTLTSGTDSPAVCNKAATVSTKSANGGIKSGTAAVAPFINTIDYTATATFGGATSSITTTGANKTGSIVTTTGAAFTSLAIVVTTISTPGANYLVAAADYTDTLTVTLTPTP